MKTRILGLATCYNRKEKTLKAIESLRQSNPECDIRFIITDDNSSDGTAQALEMIEGVTVVKGDGNSFYSGGMRLAMAKALEDKALTDGYDYILLFNDDVDFYPGAIDRLTKYGNKKEDAAESGQASDEVPIDLKILVGPTCEEDGRTLSYGGIARKSNFRPKFRKVMADAGKTLKVDTFNANCVLVPTELFVKTGNMDTVYNHSLGDFDYGYSLTRKGGEIFVSGEYVGICPFNSEEGTWNDPKLTRRERFKKKESIKGVPFGEFFHYLLKNYNLLTAIIYSFSPYVRILIGK